MLRGVFLFAVLQINEREQGILALMKNHFSKSDITVRRVKISGAQPFFIVSTAKDLKNIKWTELEKSLGRMSGSLLMPNNVTPPETANVKALTITDNLPAKILFNTAIKISKLSSLPSKCQRITVVDRAGIYLDNIENLVKQASVVRVITDKIIQYECVAQKILKRLGASVSISNAFKKEIKSDIIISPFEQITSVDSLILSTDSCRVMTPRTALSTKISLPNDLKVFLPAGIDEHEFACALFDSCGLARLAKQSFDNLLYCQELQNVQKIAQTLSKQ